MACSSGTPSRTDCRPLTALRIRLPSPVPAAPTGSSLCGLLGFQPTRAGSPRGVSIDGGVRRRYQRYKQAQATQPTGRAASGKDQIGQPAEPAQLSSIRFAKAPTKKITNPAIRSWRSRGFIIQRCHRVRGGGAAMSSDCSWLICRFLCSWRHKRRSCYMNSASRRSSNSSWSRSFLPCS